MFLPSSSNTSHSSQKEHGSSSNIFWNAMVTQGPPETRILGSRGTKERQHSSWSNPDPYGHDSRLATQIEGSFLSELARSNGGCIPRDSRPPSPLQASLDNANAIIMLPPMNDLERELPRRVWSDADVPCLAEGTDSVVFDKVSPGSWSWGTGSEPGNLGTPVAPLPSHYSDPQLQNIKTPYCISIQVKYNPQY